MIRNLKSILLLGLFIVLAGASLQADEISSFRSVSGSGGMVAQPTNGGTYLVSGVVGQTAIEVRLGNEYTLSQGFWVDNESTQGVDGGVVSFNDKVSNYPNPFNNSTTISYELQGSAYVTVRVYDVVGNVVKTIFDGYQSNGKQDLVWDGTDNTNNALGSGSYIYEVNVSPAQNAGAESFQAFTARNVMVIVR
jgi:hypothetical protein